MLYNAEQTKKDDEYKREVAAKIRYLSGMVDILSARLDNLAKVLDILVDDNKGDRQ